MDLKESDEKPDILLVRPTIELKEKAMDYRKEHFNFGEQIINGSELFDKTESYEDWLKSVTDNSNPNTVNPNWVVTDTFFAIDNKAKNIVGIIDLRHTLNDFLMNFGNCGYSVRPAFRRKGIATEMLKQLLVIAKEAGLSELHLSVEQDNIPSIKTIKKNGGVYERSFEYEGKTADIYKIKIETL
nr:GNAT family N-acetyltransferase [uncultured Clostridium sp.]